jgi:hypothetical protein
MANWQQLKQYVYSEYKVSEDIGDGIKLEFRLDGGRTQLAFVHHYELLGGNEDWIVVESPFARLDEVDLSTALQSVSNIVCGGLGLMMGQYVTLRHAVPLATLDIDEFERPLHLVTTSADKLEKRFGFSDEF